MGTHARSRSSKALAAAVALALCIAGALALRTHSAGADTRPLNASTPSTVSDDALPTAQVNGVVWNQVIAGNTVFATGSFTKARPAGSKVGVNEVPRGNILSYDITNGALHSFNHTLNAQGLALALSPDKTILYVGGDFTQVDGHARSRLAAFSVATWALLPFAPVAGSTVRSIDPVGNVVYIAGNFQSVNGVARGRVAAVRPTGELLGWRPLAEGGVVNSIVHNSANNRTVIGGSFTSVSNNTSAYGLAALDPTTGAVEPFAATNTVHNAGSNSGIYNVSTDGTHVFAGGWSFHQGGNFEGLLSADFLTGNIEWMEDCHGDTYSSYAYARTVYAVSHSHTCANTVDGFPETNPRTWHRSTAYTNYAAGTLKHNAADGYADFGGKPSPGQLNWYPFLTVGTYTGQSQAAWTITGNDKYVVIGGEFPTVNGIKQQGLVRFAVSSIAPNKFGPAAATDSLTPTTTKGPGSITLTWRATSDLDNEALLYRVYRDGKTPQVLSVTVLSRFFRLPTLKWTDKVPAGSKHTYWIIATDAFGNAASGHTITATAGGTPAAKVAPAARMAPLQRAAVAEPTTSASSTQPPAPTPGAGTDTATPATATPATTTPATTTPATTSITPPGGAPAR